MEDGILAKAFSCANAGEQASMINSMARELFVVSGGRYGPGKTMQGYETQCCYIASSLNKDGIQFIKDLHGFIELREKDMK